MGILTDEQRQKIIDKGFDPDRYERIVFNMAVTSDSISQRDKIGILDAYTTAPELDNRTSPISDIIKAFPNVLLSIGEGFATMPLRALATGLETGGALGMATGVGQQIAVNEQMGKPQKSSKALYGVADLISEQVDKWKLKPSKEAQTPLIVYNPETNKWFEGANPNNVAYSVANGLGSMAGFFLSGRAAGMLGKIGGAASKGGSLGKAFGMDVASLFGGYVYMNNELYNEFKGEGLSSSDASTLAAMSALPIAISEYVGINYIGKLISEPAKKSLIRQTVRETIQKAGGKALTKEFLEDATATTIKGGTARIANILAKGGEGMLVEGTEELVQGKLQQVAELMYDQVKQDPKFKTDPFSQEALKEDINNFFWGGVIGGMLGGGGASFNNKVMEESMFKYVGTNTNRPQKIVALKKKIEEDVKRGLLTEEQGVQGIEMVDNMVKIHKEEMPKTLTDVGARYQAYEFIAMRNDVRKRVADLDSPNVDPTLATADDVEKSKLNDIADLYDRAILEIANKRTAIPEQAISIALAEIEKKYAPIEEQQAAQEAGDEVAPEQEGGRVVEFEVGQTATEEAQTPKTDIDGLLEGEQAEEVRGEEEVRQFAERIARGEDVTSLEDQQFYENNKEEVESALQQIQREQEVTENPLADVESTAKALDEFDKGVPPTEYFELSDYLDEEVAVDETYNRTISEAYHKAKADGTNPELVQAVENLLTRKTETNEQGTQAQDKKTEEVDPIVAQKQQEEQMLVSLIDEIDMEVANLSKKRSEKAKKELEKQLERKARAEKDLEDVRTELAGLRGEGVDGTETGVGEAVGTGEEGVAQEGVEESKKPADALKDVESTAKALEGVSPKLTNTPSLKGVQIVALEDANLSATEETQVIDAINDNAQNDSWDKALRKGVENLGNGWFRVGKTTRGESIIYSPTINKSVVLKGAKSDAIAVQDFVKNNFGDTQKTAEAYHKAKADGSNPELVQAVEELLGKAQPKAIGDKKPLLEEGELDSYLSEVSNGRSFNELVRENNLSTEQEMELQKAFAESKSLPKKQFGKNDKIQNNISLSDDVNVLPIEKKISKPKTKIESVAKIASKDEMRPVMMGVFKDAENKRLVATDAHKLVAIEDKTIKKTEVVDAKTGKVIEGNYPKYDSVIPKDNPIKRKVNVNEWIPQLNGLANTKKFFEKQIAVRIKIGDMDFYFNPELMLEVFNFMAENGISEVELQLSKPNQALVVESNKGAIGLVMPFFASEEYIGGAKTLHSSALIESERKGIIQQEIDYLKERKAERIIELKEAEKELANATEEERYGKEFSVEYAKKRIAEYESEIEQKQNEIDNPIQEKEDLETVTKSINNGEVTKDNAKRYTEKPTKRTRKVEKSIEAVESKAESDSETELNEAIENVDGLISGQISSVELPSQVRPQRQVKANQKVATEEVAEARGEDVKDMDVLYSTLFRNLPVIDDTDTDAMLTYETEGMPTGLEKDKVPPQIRKRVEKLMDKGYVYYNEGNFYLTPKGAEIVDAIDARLETRKGVKEGTDLFPDEANIEENKLTAAEAKSVADKIRGLKINTKGKAFDATLGLPVAIYNGAVELIATSVEGGMMLKNAIAKAMKYIDEQMGGKNWNKGLFAKDMNVRFAVTLPNGERAIVERDTSKKTAKVIDGWYLPIEQKVLNNKQDKMPANNWAGLLRSKEDEDLWTGVREFLESKGSESVTKKELQDFIKNNRVEIVKVVKGMQNFEQKVSNAEKKYGIKIFVEEDGFSGAPIVEIFGDKLKDLTDDEYDALKSKVEKDLLSGEDSPTKFSQYVLEGDKENYKEVLVTLPNREQKSVSQALGELGYKIDLDLSGDYWIEDKNGELIEYDDLPNDVKKIVDDIGEGGYDVADRQKVLFKSTHFDEPNILVHLRMNTRTDADGKKVLFVEEIQSDWGQKGKKEGFKNGEKITKVYASEIAPNVFEIRENNLSVVDKIVAKNKEEAIEKYLQNPIIRSGAIPTAPFVTDTNSWVKLGLKVAMQEAVKQGADKIAWTTGTQQFDRWGSEKIDWVTTMKPNGGSIIVKDASKAPIIRGRRTQNLASISSELDTQKEINRIAEKWGLKPSDLEFQVTGRWNISIQEQFRGTAFEGMNVDERALSERGIAITSKEDLKAAIDRNLSREKTETERQKLADRVWDRMQKEDSGTSLPRKEGMENFYGSPTEGSIGIVGNVAKSLFKQDVGTVELQTTSTGTKGQDKVLRFRDWVWSNKTDDFSYSDAESNINSNSELYQEYQKNIPTQHSIEVTPELKREVERGLPMFGNVDVKIGENTLGSAIAGANMLDQAFKAGVDLSQSVEDNIQEMEDKGIIKKDCK